MKNISEFLGVKTLDELKEPINADKKLLKERLIEATKKRADQKIQIPNSHAL